MLLVLLGASIILVRDYIEPHDRVVKSLDLIQKETATNAAFGDSHFAWGFVGKPDFPTLGAEGETILDMELRVRYYFRDKQPGKVVIQGDPHSFAGYKMDRATHEYLQNMDNQFWQRFLEHHRQYMGLYWQRVFERGGFDVFRPADELRWGWIVRTRAVVVARFQRTEWLGARARGLPEARLRVPQRGTGPKPQADARVFGGTWRGRVRRDDASELRVLRVRERRFEHCRGHELRAAGGGGDWGALLDFFALFAEPEFANYFRDMDHMNEIGAPHFTAMALSACFGGPTNGALGSSRQ